MTQHAEEHVLCHTPTPNKKPIRILRWKYDLVREAILAALPVEPESIVFTDLPGMVERRLSSEDLSRLGSVSWYTTVVKLDMEVKGEIERLPGITPQRLRRK
jgi:hypothetical protein